ncbi:MAG: prepilin peptidase [Alphaproteobacteria bacterium]|nr:prepilin peptidase [Alphaproteobacteria bacterium]
MTSGATLGAAALLLAAPFVGSFVATLVYRLPRGRPVVWSRSACPACGTTLGPVDLVPVLGWLWRRGRCRACDAAISASYPLTELACLALALWAWAAAAWWPALPIWSVWAVAVLGWTLLALALIDARHFLLPDSVTLPLAAGGPALAALGLLPGGVTLADSALGLVLGFAVLWAAGEAYRRLRGRAGLGLGDAKLLAAAGAWTGWAGLPGVVLIAALSGLVSALLIAAIRRRRLRGATPVPFGVHLALGTWLVVLYGPLELRP